MTGTTPHRWLLDQRLLLAQRLLEETDLPVERVAQDAGFGAAVTLRAHFTRWAGLSPQAYRQTWAPATRRRPRDPVAANTTANSAAPTSTMVAPDDTSRW